MTIKPVTPSDFSSQLFPALIDAFKPVDDRPLRVLDLGPASAASVRYFGQYRCTLRFADLQPEELASPRPDDGTTAVDPSELAAHYQRILDLPTGSKFDICLFWDYFNHLETTALRAFSEVLRPHLHSASRGHGFGVLSRGNPLYHQSYGVQSANLLMVAGTRKELPLRFPHSQSGLNNQLSGLEVRRSVLRSDGRLEMLLHTA